VQGRGRLARAAAVAVALAAFGCAGAEAAILPGPPVVEEDMLVPAQSSESPPRRDKSDAPLRPSDRKSTIERRDIAPRSPGSRPLSRESPDQDIPHRVPECGIGQGLEPCRPRS
jgi:hypothetical protein